MLLLLASAGLLLTPPDDRDNDRDAAPAATRPAPAQRDADDEEEEEDRARPDSPITVTGHRLDAARTRIDDALGASVYALDNEAIENRPGGETGSLAATLTQAPGVTEGGAGPAVRGARGVQVRINDV